MSNEQIRTDLLEIGNAVSAIFFTIPRFTPNYLTQKQKYTIHANWVIEFSFFFELFSWRICWTVQCNFWNKHFFSSFCTARSILYALLDQAKLNILEYNQFNFEISFRYNVTSKTLNKQKQKNCCRIIYGSSISSLWIYKFDFFFSLTVHLLHIQPIT